MKLRASWHRLFIGRPDFGSDKRFQLGSLSLFPSLEVAGVFVAGGGIGLSGERILDALEKLNILCLWPLP
jgi:hypothetical protein